MKKYQVLKIIIIIISIILLGSIAYIGISFHNKNSSKQEIVPELKPISLNSPIINKSMDLYNNLELNEEPFLEDRYTKVNLTKYNYILASLKELSINQVAYCIDSKKELEEPVTISELNTILNRISNVSIKLEDIERYSIENKDSLGDYNYGNYSIIVNKDNLYIIEDCNDDYTNTYDYQIIKAESNDRILNIYIKVAFKTLSKDKKTANWYQTPKREKLIETISIKESPNYELYNAYKITFKIENNQIVFENVNIQK